MSTTIGAVSSEGLLAPASGVIPPTTPTLTATSAAAGTGFTATFTGADADTTNTLEYKTPTASTWTDESVGKAGSTGSWDITVGAGWYFLRLTSTDADGLTVQTMAVVNVVNSSTRKIQFRVKNVIHIPGKSRKKLILEKIDKPIGYGPS